MKREVTICILMSFFVLGIAVGASATMIYSDNDYSCGLENYATAITNRNSFEMATNIAVYAGNGNKNISVSRLISNGDWDTDPTALPNLQSHIQLNAPGYALNLGIATLGVTDLSNINMLFFAGHTSFSYTTQQISLLKTFLDNGGLMWIDDCAGSSGVSAFESSFDDLVFSMYGAHLSVLSPNHLVFKSYYNLSGSDFSFTQEGNGTEWAQLPLLGYENHPNQDVVPEPATMLLLGIGLTGIAVLRKRVKK